MNKKQTRLHWQAMARECLLQSGVELEEANGAVGWTEPYTEKQLIAREWAYNEALKISNHYNLETI